MFLPHNILVVTCGGPWTAQRPNIITCTEQSERLEQFPFGHTVSSDACHSIYRSYITDQKTAGLL
eukprot:9238741-Pyramimonas_sp.AAC.1